ncbi:MAG: type II toxin-antitoxin system VapC family toxin [Chloroflexota bacterium]|nr:type II toxin-antitoxin system VapC family toxin [Chloroflexota bacterium]
MPSFVTDTHALIWSLRNNSLLGSQAGPIFEACQRGEITVAIPTICLVEIVYLEEKGRIPPGMIAHLYAVLQAKTTKLILEPLTADIADTLRRVPRAEVSDMPDRIIAATALHLGVPLISRDRRIQLSAVATVW